MKEFNLNVNTFTEGFKTLLPRLGRYAILFFLLLLTAVYSFVLLRIENLRNVQPNSSDVSAQVQASTAPHVDPTVVRQMQTLQDNSVSVQALFNQARNSPFQE